MPYTDYEKAQKQGVKALRTAIVKGENEYLPVLDEILDGVDIVGEQLLGLYDIPLDRVVGTSTHGRTYAFANNFMPILDLKSEFGAKWTALCDSQIEEGIHEPIKVFEYMANYYVVEGNKRVSVLKYFEAATIPAIVTRKIPKLTDDLQVKIYYEYMDCFKYTGINYLWFSQEGCFKRLLELTSENPKAVWTEDQRKDFGSFNHRFSSAIKSMGAQKLHMPVSEALLVFIDIFGYDEVKIMAYPSFIRRIKRSKLRKNVTDQQANQPTYEQHPADRDYHPGYGFQRHSSHASFPHPRRMPNEQ